MFKKFVLILIAAIVNLTNTSALALTVHMAGDSTMAEKDPKDYPETGWGVPFAIFFSDEVQVLNYARNGRSTRTFIEEGLWRTLISAVKPGDVVFIQFGHNDEVPTKVDRYTTPEQYKKNLKRFAQEVKAKQAQAILLTPIIRRNFDDQSKLNGIHPYSKYVREVAVETKTEWIDMEAMTHQYFSELGDANSATRFMHIPSVVHPNYPNGVRDNTHLNELGAREVAQLLLAELKKRDHVLAKHTRKVDPKHLKLHY